MSAEFRIAESFTASLGRLQAAEQKAAKVAALDLQLNPAAPGLHFHRIEKSRDKHFWSLRASLDIRLIVHKTEASFLIAYAGHHDDAYAWAERRRIEAHPRTGAMQVVELRELVEEIAPPVLPAAHNAPALLFRALTTEQLLGIGVPTDWMADVQAATEDAFLALADHLPAEAAEALLEYAATGRLRPSQPAGTPDPFAHLDTLRRFRAVESEAELQAAMDAPWDRWAVFLHPSQRAVVARSFNGPARTSGSAGTGKTVVALHRAARLASEHRDARVLLTTFSQPLANALGRKLRVLLGPDSAAFGRITVAPYRSVADEL
ncbi:MAG: UvrD-helicase domain-containing protein, partial [Acetobacteraceae bacterium]|nr:UvrD-helicase domain-containing protein [Acetobacteraceae bacterium]